MARRGITSIYTKGPGMDRGLYAAFLRLRDLAGEYALNVRFSAQPEDSPSVEAAVASFVGRGLAGYHNWDLEFRQGNVRLVDLDDLPGGHLLYEDLADVFLHAYNLRPDPRV